MYHDNSIGGLPYRAPMNPAFVRRAMEKRKREEAEQRRIAAREALAAKADRALKDAQERAAMKRELAKAKQDFAAAKAEMDRMQAEIDTHRKAEKVAAFEQALAALDAAKAGNRGYTFAMIEAKAIKLFGISKRELRSNRRNREIVFARQFIMYWTARLTEMSLPQIGRLMGGRDHTTVLHGKGAYVKKRASMGRSLKPAR